MTETQTPPAETIVLVVEAQAAPGNAGRVTELIGRFVEPTRKETGCVQYRLHVDAADDHHVVLVEEWQDEAALSAHQATSGYADLMRALVPLLAGEGRGLRLYPHS